MVKLFNTALAESEIRAVADICRGGRFVMGPEAAKLEGEIARYIGDQRYVVHCNSGTDALVLALRALGKGKRVGVPAWTFSATYEAVLLAGHEPVVYDVDPALGFTASPWELELAGLQALIVVHLWGWPAPGIKVLADLCEMHNVFLIEDCAQAFGAEIWGKKVGTFGDAAAFSFYPTKPLGGCGDGGAVAFKSELNAEQAAKYRNHGRGAHYQEFPGTNSRLDEISATVLRMRLANYEDTVRYQGELVKEYKRRIGDSIMSPRVVVDFKPAPYVMPVMVANRDRMQNFMKDRGIETGVHYDQIVSKLTYTSPQRISANGYVGQIVSLPCHRGMSIGDVQDVCDAFQDWQKELMRG